MLQSQGIEVHEADESGVPGWIEQGCPDVISGHHAPTWALAAARHVGVPCIETFHGPHHLFGADWQAEAARGANLSAIVSVCELLRQQYLAGNPHFPSDRIVVIPNGVDDERRSGGDRVATRSRLGLTDEYLFRVARAALPIEELLWFAIRVRRTCAQPPRGALGDRRPT